VKFSRSFWVAAIAGIMGTVYYLSFPEKWNTGVVYSNFWPWLPRVSMLAACFGIALIVAWITVSLLARLISHSQHRDAGSGTADDTSMKTSQFIFVCLLVFGLSSSLGFLIGVRTGFHQAYVKEMNDDLESADENEQFEARAYLRCLQDIDSGDITNLHDWALRHVRFYVQSVQEDRQMGNTWASPWIYSNAAIYVSEHPQKADAKLGQ
jgi:hypothetical protein